MKKISSVLFVCLSLLFFASCKKSSGGGSNYYIKANVDGTEKTYTSTPLAFTINQSGTYSLNMSASASKDTSSYEGLSLQINQSGAPVTAGTYIDGTSGANYVLAGIYNPGTSNLSSIFAAGAQLSTTAPFTITITSISSSQVSGTFNGEYFDNDGFGSNSVIITNGEFSLPIQ
ncbi:MAG: hypothetical protein JO072_11050 [Parafilimonas sp.]|nr:hypothetical protein [Parafilimonas sp.]